MIKKEEILKIIKRYDRSKVKIATICSHSALQIFYGAKQEGFETIGICKRERKKAYEAFPIGKPDKFIIVDDFKEILREENMEVLRKENAIVIPHGSFVEYVGPENLENKFFVPMFGNRKTLGWERNRKKQRQWLEKSNLILPKEFKSPSEINGKVFVKFSGARGGRGFFIANSKEGFEKKLEEKVNNGMIKKEDSNNITLQEFISGVRYYIHYFYSSFYKNGAQVGEGRVELLSMDKRIELIDEIYRGLPEISEEFFDYTVTGNQPIIIRESLIPDLIQFGVNV
ncbi:formate--phosphoribosylaminoimidazolecarboxamide ligase, partial [Patescibacteria group bacterium AH-259-L07]|nr:formate--phosphoribosylaminoimidazolecarboxamide ligase [Patescibacteria group bacterium AH-259-L07]